MASASNAGEPCPLAFSALHDRITAPLAKKEEILVLLDQNKSHLWTALSETVSRSAHVEAEISYVRYPHIVSKFPKPTPAEDKCIRSLSAQYSIPRSQAANLLRDYLNDRAHEPLGDLLETKSDLSLIAPPYALQSYWLNETNALCSIFSKLFLAAASGTPQSLHAAASLFVSTNEQNLKKCVLDASMAALSVYGNNPCDSLIPVLHPSSYLEILFSLTLCLQFSPSEREALLKAYAGLITCKPSTPLSPSATSVEMPSSRSAFPILDGAVVSALFTASFNSMNRTREAVQKFTASKEKANPVQISYATLDSATVSRFESVFKSLRAYPSPETAVLSFSWASIRELEVRGHFSNESENLDESALAYEHMSTAISNNVFSIFEHFIVGDVPLKPAISPHVFRVFWDDIDAFLCAFPPRDFIPMQVSQLVGLATQLLNEMLEHDVVRVARSLWEAEANLLSIGTTSLLRVASGIFPQTFRPLTNFLAALIVDCDGAKKAASYLSELISITERSDSSQNAFYVLDDDEGDIVYSVTTQRGIAAERVSQLIEMVRPSHEDIIFVQTPHNIPADSYRPQIDKGTIGISNVSQTHVTWIMSWNGFGAIVRILQFLLRILTDQDNAMQYDDIVIEELLIHSIDSLKFIENLFDAAPSSLPDGLLADIELVRLVSLIVSLIANPGDRARASWLTRRRQIELLNVSSTSLASLACSSPERARFALETIEGSQKGLPFRSALSLLAEDIFPAMAAISQIAYRSAHGDVVSDELRHLLDSSLTTNTPFQRDSLWYGRSPSSVTNFLVGSVFPLWLTVSPSEGSHCFKNHHLYWLLPACSLQLLTTDLSLLLESSIATSLLTAVILGSCENVDSETLDEKDTFLFPALRIALSACFLALRLRNGVLQEENSPSTKGDRTVHRKSDTKNSLDVPCTLENSLLKPDVTYALACLASGLAEKTKSDEFFDRWRSPKFRRFMSDPDMDRYMALNPTVARLDKPSVGFWRTWVAEMSARCLALQFCCLSQLPGPANKVQAAWPAFQEASFGSWRGGGAIIRKSFASIIRSNGSIPHIELLVSVLSCGQRAAARSLLAPRANSRFKGDNTTGSVNSEVSSIPGAASTATSEILSSVILCLQESYEEWCKIADSFDTDTAEKRLQFLKLGQICLKISVCVRFLRIAWESNNSKWFENCWEELKAWDILSQLIRCEGSNSKRPGKLDFSKAISFNCILSTVNELEDKKNELKVEQLQKLVRELTVAVDISSCWKSIGADVLHLFASEIVHKTSIALSNGVSDSTGGKEDGSDKLPTDVYTTGAFPLFQSVFTERWMHVLFDVRDAIKTLSSSKTPSEASKQNKIKTLYECSEEEFMSVEERVRSVSAALSKLVFSFYDGSKDIDVIRCFQRKGDIVSRFGVDYCFDISMLFRFVLMAKRPVPQMLEIVIDFARINTELTTQDVQAEVVSVFSAMSSAVVFADSFCSQPTALLSYSSPQFGGKVCRYLCKYLECIAPTVLTSTHAVAIASEVSKLIASLSARLSIDELDQVALTGVRFQSFRLPEDAVSTNSVGQLCSVIDDLVNNIKGLRFDEKNEYQKLDIVRWLLLTSSKLVAGSAFRSRGDLIALTRTTIKVLNKCSDVVFVALAASVALSAAVTQKTDNWHVSLRVDDVNVIFKTICTLCAVQESDKDVACQIAGILLLTIGQGYCLQGVECQSARSFVLRQLSGGSILRLLPPESHPVQTYDIKSGNRNPQHFLWCACLRLATIAIADGKANTIYGGGEVEVRDVLELACTTLGRISRDSFNFNGDWPASAASANVPWTRKLTIAKVEEAEVAAMTMFRLSNFAIHLRGAFPDLLGLAVAQLMRYIDQSLRLLRAEPVERWVHPVTQWEKERSFLHQGNKDFGATIGTTVGTPPWMSSSPGKGQSPSSPTPARRSPMQALRAAVGDGSGRGSPVPPSPGFTPLSPTIGMPGSGQLISSPLSPWIPHGAGLISETGLYYGEEVSRALLRGLGCALSALRRLTVMLDAPVYCTSLVAYDDPPGIGSLLNILHHAGGELQRGTEEIRRNFVMTIAENAYILIVFHAGKFVDEGLLVQPVFDELKRRAINYVLRIRRCVPPPPKSSALVSKQMDRFWEQLH